LETLTPQRLDSDEFKSEGLNEKQAVATWDFGNFSAIP
jgi:hypothetical protein